MRQVPRLDKYVQGHLPRGILLLAGWIACWLGIEHILGLYEPSEVTGRLTNLGAQAGTFGLIAWVTRESDGEARIGTRLLRGVLVAFTAAAILASARAVYFGVFWDDFAARMGDFTTATLISRNASPEQISRFSGSVVASWTPAHVAINDFMFVFVWGSVFSLARVALLSFVAPAGSPEGSPGTDGTPSRRTRRRGGFTSSPRASLWAPPGRRAPPRRRCATRRFRGARCR